MKHFAMILVTGLVICCLTGCSFIQLDRFLPFTQPPAEENTVSSFRQDSAVQTESPVAESQVAETETATEQAATEEQAPATESAIEESAPTASWENAAEEKDHSAKIQQIRAWYQEIVSDPTLESKTYGDAATVYWRDGEVISIAEYWQLSDDYDPPHAAVHYYYHEGEPFFVYIQYYNMEPEEVRLYFFEGELIRWKIDDNAPNDNSPNAEWQSYYAKACTALENSKELN